ncbi:MAG: glutamine--fructose-6-phosphate transaminase (isomerizing) [Ardenticatenales bacterium]
MCGIVGYVGGRDALPILLDGLSRLEYRGYDSAGVALVDDDHHLGIRKAAGKLSALRDMLAADAPTGRLGIGHTRWATHGAPTTPNAHPHTADDDRVAIIHNGIFENHAAIKGRLIGAGRAFTSETDTEVLAHLIAEAMDQEPALSAPSADPADRRAAFTAAVRTALLQVEGAYAIAAISPEAPGLIVAARKFSPLVVGVGDGESLLASDIPALLPYTRRIVLLEDGEMVELTADGVRLSLLDGTPVTRDPITIDWSAEAAEKGGYRHFVRKEIDEQPRALVDTLRGRIVDGAVVLPELDAIDLDAIRRVTLIACGTSAYAGLVGARLLSRWAGLPADVAIASEFRYGDPIVGPDTLVIGITQSGETADTLAALRRAKLAGAPTLALCNVVGSSVTRLADATLFLQVGPEIGVVATKTFTAQLALLTLLSVSVAARVGRLAPADAAAILTDLTAIPSAIQAALACEPTVAAIVDALDLVHTHSMFFIGRGFGYPVALEGALKLKEISYIHAEGYPAGELKHGPIAMLDPAIPVLAVATPSPVHEKVLSNIEEVRARGARTVVIAAPGDAASAAVADHLITVPTVREELSPLVDVIPVQLLSYHAAVARGCDVDQPRNLAKSVTVE